MSMTINETTPAAAEYRKLLEATLVDKEIEIVY